MATYVQFGCGWDAADGWLNFDASPTLRVERLPVVGRRLGRLAGNPEPFPQSVRFGDIVAGLPLADNSVDGLYASHVLEHLAYSDMATALANSFRVLKPGGVFRLIVPDLKARAAAYVAAANDDPEAAHRFMRDTYLGREHRGRSMMGRIRVLFGNSDHLWMYDYPSMKAELEKAGFVAVRPAKLGDAEDAMFSRVENPGRFVDEGIAEVAVEARKPG